MVKMSLILTGDTEGVSNVGETFSIVIKRRKTTASPTENHRFPYKNHWFRRRKPDVDVNVNVYVSGGEEEEAYTHKQIFILFYNIPFYQTNVCHRPDNYGSCPSTRPFAQKSQK